MSKLPKILGVGAVALTLLLAVGPASAALITTWEYEIQNGFSAFSPDGSIPDGVEGSDPNAVLGTPTVLSWGENSDGESSQLIVDETVTGTIETNGDAAAGASLTHVNNAIPSSHATLESATLTSTIVLTPLSPEGDPLDPVEIDFLITFEETLNNGDCVDGSVSDCDDVFVLVDVSVLDFAFQIDDYIYTVSLDVAGLGVLPDEACDQAGAESGCVGFLTPEGDSTPLVTSFTITAVRVAEPASLALLGLGMIGLGLARRRTETTTRPTG